MTETQSASDSSLNTTDSSPVPLTRDEITQERHGIEEFENLSEEKQREVERIYDRQPFADGMDVTDIKTRDEIAQEKCGDDFENLSWKTRWKKIEPAYDDQFRQPDSFQGIDLPRYDRQEIANKSYGVTDLKQLTYEERLEVEERFDRQPFIPFDRTEFGEPGSIEGLMTRDEIAQHKQGQDFQNLSQDGQAAIEDLYDEQYVLPISGAVGDDARAPKDDTNETDEAFFDVENATAARTDGNVTVSANVENTGDAAGEQNVTFSLEGQGIERNGDSVDVVFLIDNSGSMTEEISTVNQELTNFSNELESEGVNARYAVVTFTDGIETTQGFTENVTETQQTFDQVENNSGGGSEYSYPAVNETVQSTRNLSTRSEAQTVYIVLTDEGTNFQTAPANETTYQQQLRERLEANEVALFGVTPPDNQLEGNTVNPTIGQLANATADGQWYNLYDENFGDQFAINVSADIVNVTRDDQQTVYLDSGESTSVEFTINGSDIPDGNYTVTVSSEDDSDSQQVVLGSNSS